MDPSSQFFNKLRKLAVNLETETTKLQAALENRKVEGDDSERTARGMRAYHQLNCEVVNIKGQIQEQVTREKSKVDEVKSFIKKCEVMQQKLSDDINIVKAYWEKYGYQPPKNTETATNHASDNVCKEEGVKEDGTESTEEEAHCEENGEKTPEKASAPVSDPLRTPQLSDFGLSEIQLKRALAGKEWCPEAPPMPEITLPQLSLKTPARPTMAVTPVRALRMDDEELLTPQMHDFGISEHTMCFNNDFTMDLRKKNLVNPLKPEPNLLEPPVNPLMESLQANVDLESPEIPAFCTPGLKIKKTNPSAAPEQDSSDLDSPMGPPNLPSTPEVPTFQTPYVNRLASTRKSERRPEPIKMQSVEDLELPSPQNGAASSKRSWEYNVPSLTIEDMMDNGMPEMPNLESNLGNILQTKSAKKKFLSLHEKPVVSSLDLDGPTTEFNLGTPCVRPEYEEPNTPEMPDLSSVTQDICKLLSQTQMKKRPHEKENTSPPAVSLCGVSEQEFHSLPGYLRQMTLNSLNQAVHNINSSINKWKGDKAEFHIDELKKMINFGAKTPMFILCLTELKRLDHIKGAKNNSVYKLNTHA